jgi:hypothetical protein
MPVAMFALNDAEGASIVRRQAVEHYGIKLHQPVTPRHPLGFIAPCIPTASEKVPEDPAFSVLNHCLQKGIAKPPAV